MPERRQILSSAVCGCFYCLKTFPPDEIIDWVDIDETSGLGQTALCPFCSVDSVLGFPAEVQDIDGYLRRRNMRSFGPGGIMVPAGGGNGIMDRTAGWPLVGFGAMVLIITAAMVLGSTKSALSSLALPVALPAMLVGYGPALLVPAVLFVVYNVVVLGFKIARITPFTRIMTGLLVLQTGVLSTWYYLASWTYVGTYVDFSTAVAWTTMDVLLAITTFVLFGLAIRVKKPAWMVIAHIVLFVWIFSYAFPWIGEMI